MPYGFQFWFAFALSLALMAGCSDENGDGGSGGTGGTGGTGGERWDAWFWDEDECPGCQCQGAGELFTTTLDCFCCRYHCDPRLGPFGSDLIDSQTIIEYDCNRRYVYNFTENPSIEFMVDTTTNEVIGASYRDDCCICSDGLVLSAGVLGVPDGCNVVSEQNCGGPCDVGAFEVQP